MIALLLAPTAARGGNLPDVTGMPLARAVEIIAAHGELEVVFSESVVRPEMRVARQPSSDQPLEALREILRPHGLSPQPGPGGRVVVIALPTTSLEGVVSESLGGTPLEGVVVRVSDLELELSTTSDEAGRYELDGVPVGPHSIAAALGGVGSTLLEVVLVEADTPTRLDISIDLSLAAEQIVVSPSVISIRRSEPTTTLTLEAEALAALPIAGGDQVRAARLLPGIAGADFSARSNVRGGRADEVLVLLDGLELLEPYHLPDFEDALSIVPPRTIERTDVISGGFPATYGDRMSGVLDMTTRSPGTTRQSHLGLSTLDSHLGSMDRFADGDGEWLLSGRLTTADLATDQAGFEEDPRYWDLLGKVGYRWSESQGVRLNWLGAYDDFRFNRDSAAGVREERIATEYRNSSVWLTHDAQLGRDVNVETLVSTSRLARDRVGVDFTSPGFSVHDRREYDSLGVQLRGTDLVRPGVAVEWGLEARRLDATYDYLSTNEARALGSTRATIDFEDRFTGRQFAAYVSTRLEPKEDLVIEIGVRFDENEVVDDSHVSPRLSMAWAAGSRSVLRLAWGHFYQSQRAYELPVEDGETTFLPDERLVSTVVSWERAFGRNLHLRVEGYDKVFSDPRPRYENLFDPVSRFPEVEPDRVRIAPQRAHGRGVEVLLRRSGSLIDWMASYAYSRIEDEIDGRDVPRPYDQPHALTLSATYRVTPQWTLGASLVYHSGWPRTPVGLGTDSSGQPQLDLGSIYSARLGDYTRLDLRLARTWTLGHGRITTFLEVLNVLETENVRGFEYEIVSAAGGQPFLEAEPKHWLGTVPILGVDWDL